MFNNRKGIIALLFISVFGIVFLVILAQPLTDSYKYAPKFPPFKDATLYFDSSCSMSANAVLATMTDSCTSLLTLPFNAGYTSLPVWIHLQPTKLEQDMIICIKHPLLDSVEIFTGKSSHMTHYASCGYLTSKRYPAIQDVSPCFYTPKELNNKSILIKIITTDVCAIKIKTYCLSAFASLTKSTFLLYGLYFGAIIIIAIINIFLFLTVRFSSSFWYAFYILSFALFQAFSTGLIEPFYVNYNMAILKNATPFFTGTCIVFGSLFIIDFLSLSTENLFLRISSCTFKLFAITGAALAIMTLFGHNTFSSIASSIIAPFFVLACLIVGIGRISSLGRPAIFCTISVTLLTIGIALNALRNFGILPNTFITAHGNLVGSVFEFLILAIALVDRVSTIENDKIRADQDARYAKQLATENRLKALQAQINPHFLFNTLNTLVEFVSVFPQKAEKLVLSLSKFFRYTLTISEKKMAFLKDEIEIVRTYLSIEKERFGKRLSFNIIIEDDITHVTVPGLIIQPIIENSIKYGIAPLSDGGTITLRCGKQDDSVVISVHDTGPGFVKNANHNSTSHGLFNVRERLKLLYGQRASLTCSNSNGARVELIIPIRIMDALEDTATFLEQPREYISYEQTAS